MQQVDVDAVVNTLSKQIVSALGSYAARYRGEYFGDQDRTESEMKEYKTQVAELRRLRYEYEQIVAGLPIDWTV